jgi:phosphoribosyl-ATP pyrophosphohydrolase
MNTLQSRVNEFMQEMGWSYFSAEKIIAKIDEELGEMKAEVISGDVEKLEMEMGDLLFAIACFCNKNNISMDEALSKAIEKDKVRDKNRY